MDVAAEFQGDGVEMAVVAQFPVGKLGMSMEKNGVSEVGAGSGGGGVCVGAAAAYRWLWEGV